jgi:hypothetical protein
MVEDAVGHNSGGSRFEMNEAAMNLVALEVGLATSLDS